MEQAYSMAETFIVNICPGYLAQGGAVLSFCFSDAEITTG